MNRAQLEHVIRAASAIAQDDELVIIGSQAILGAHPDAPDELCLSADVDLYPRHKPELADLIEGSIGEISPFHESFGYYAQGVGPETAILPAGWEARLVPVRAGRSGRRSRPTSPAAERYLPARGPVLIGTSQWARTISKRRFSSRLYVSWSGNRALRASASRPGA